MFCWVSLAIRTIITGVGAADFPPKKCNFLVFLGHHFWTQNLGVKAPLLFVIMEIVYLSIFSSSKTTYGFLTLGNF